MLVNILKRSGLKLSNNSLIFRITNVYSILPSIYGIQTWSVIHGFHGNMLALAALIGQIGYLHFFIFANLVPSEWAFSTMNYLLNKFCAKYSVDSVDKSIYKYIYQQTLKRAINEFKVLSDLSEDEIADLEDEVIHLIEAWADLVPPSFLPTIADINHI